MWKWVVAVTLFVSNAMADAEDYTINNHGNARPFKGFSTRRKPRSLLEGAQNPLNDKEIASSTDVGSGEGDVAKGLWKNDDFEFVVDPSKQISGKSRPMSTFTEGKATTESNTNVMSDIVGDTGSGNNADVRLEEPVQLKAKRSGVMMARTDTEYVRWNRDDCRPCEMPTQPPTIDLLYPDGSSEFVEHVPTVGDEEKSWEDIKEDLAPTTNVDNDLLHHHEGSTYRSDSHSTTDDISYEGDDGNQVNCSKVISVDGENVVCNDTSPIIYTHCHKIITENGDIYTCDKVPMGSLTTPFYSENTSAPITEITPNATSSQLPIEPAPGVPPLKTNTENTTMPEADTITVPYVKSGQCPMGEQSIGVAGWDHDGCINSSNVCVATTFGDCPNGAHCSLLYTGVYGCKDGCSRSELIIPVVGWDHYGCTVSKNPCVANVKHGDCPKGASCTFLGPEIYGCVAITFNSATKENITSVEYLNKTQESDETKMSPTGTTISGVTSSSKGSSTENPNISPNGNVKEKGTATNTQTADKTAASSGHALSAGAIAGIVIGCIVFVALVVGSVLFRQKLLARQHEESLFANLSDSPESDYVAM